MAGLSFGAEKALKKIFGSGIPPEAVELGQLVDKLSPAQKKNQSKMFLWDKVSLEVDKLEDFLDCLHPWEFLLPFRWSRTFWEKE